MIYEEKIFKCHRCGNPRIIEYEKSFDCRICKDDDGRPLEFDKEDFIKIKDKSNILSVQEKLAIIKAFENKLADPENHDNDDNDDDDNDDDDDDDNDDKIFKCPRCGNPRIIEYEKSFDCTICKDDDGRPLEFDKEDFIKIKDKSNILSVQEKLVIIKAFENKLADPENHDDEGSKNSNRKQI